MDIKDTIDYQIKTTAHAMLKMYNHLAAKFSMSHATVLVLLSISKEGTPSTSIAPSLGMEATSMSRIMNSLEENGLIYREKDKKDKRKVRVFLTKDGEIKRKIAKEMITDFNDLIREKIPKSKLNLFYEIMVEINQTMVEYKEQNNL